MLLHIQGIYLKCFTQSAMGVAIDVTVTQLHTIACNYMLRVHSGNNKNCLAYLKGLTSRSEQRHLYGI